jgi:hypothetical protein
MAADDPSRAVQLDPIKPKLKALETECLKQKYSEALSNIAFNVNLRRYTPPPTPPAMPLCPVGPQN